MIIENIALQNVFYFTALLTNFLLVVASLTLVLVVGSGALCRALFFFYLSSTVFYLGMFAYPLQESPESIILWFRVSRLGLVWMPVTWVWTVHHLSDRKPGPFLWSCFALGAGLTLALFAADNPALIGKPFIHDQILNTFRPSSRVLDPLIIAFVFLLSAVSLYLVVKWRDRQASSAPIRSINWSVVFLFFTGAHDALVRLDLIPPFLGVGWIWLGSICFGVGLGVAVLFHAKEIRDRVADNESRLRILVESSRDPILSLDINRIIIGSNPAIEQVLGYTRQELLGQAALILHASPESYQEFGRTVYTQVAEQGSWRGRWPYRHKDGRTVVTDTAISALKDDSGGPIGYLAVLRDVTREVVSAEVLQRQNKYLEALHQTSVGLIRKSDPDSLLNTIVSRAAELMQTSHGWIATLDPTGDRLITRHGVGVYKKVVGVQLKRGEGVSGRVWEAQARVVVDSFGDFPKEYRKELKDITILAGVPLFSGQELIGVLGVGREKGQPAFGDEEVDLLSRLAQMASIILDNAMAYDRLQRELGEREKAERARLDSEQRYRDLFESVSDLIYTQDLEGRYITLNPAVAATLGHDREYLYGKNPQEFMKPEYRDLFTSEYLSGIKNRGRHRGVGLFLDRSGEEKYIEFSSVLVKPKSGPAYISGVGRDVTEKVLTGKKLKGLRAQLAQSQKLEAVGTLAGGVAHDFNNILQAFSGYLDMLEMDSQDPDQVRRHLPEIRRVVERAAGLVRRLMTFSRKEVSVLGPVDLNREIESTVKIMERIIPKMIAIKTDLDPDLAPVRGNPSQLEQVLMNLGVNAKDAMPEGGTLTISTRGLTLDREETDGLLEVRPGDYVLLTVSDTGAGMDRETLEHIYEPFFTTKEVGQGTGLGLSLVYGIVKDHGGFLRCKSAPGKGTEFSIHLPVHQGCDRVAPDEARESASAAGTGQTILVVDDEATVRSISRDLLTGQGYVVLTATSGEEALKVYSENRDRIELVILDLGMPGMGGLKCLEKLMEMDPSAKVIIASGYNDPNQIRRVEEMGASGFLGKPFRLHGLLAKVAEVMGE